MNLLHRQSRGSQTVMDAESAGVPFSIHCLGLQISRLIGSLFRAPRLIASVSDLMRRHGSPSRSRITSLCPTRSELVVRRTCCCRFPIPRSRLSCLTAHKVCAECKRALPPPLPFLAPAFDLVADTVFCPPRAAGKCSSTL